MKKFFFSSSFLLLLLSGVVNAHAATAPLASHQPANSEMAAKVMVIKNPEVKLYLQGSNKAEGIMDIQNQGMQSHILIAAYTPIDQETVLHKTITHNGTTKMMPIKQILIPAKKSTDLTFEGLHLMLKGILHPLTVGATVPLTLVFDDGSALIIPAKVIG